MNTLAQKGEQEYFAVIGDLRSSRQVRRRGELQEKLGRAMELLNRALAPHLAAALVITVGDEFQGLLRHPEPVIDLLNRYDEAMDGLPTRFGLGWGPLTTQLKPDAIGMDGPCFHAAREAIVLGKAAGRWVTVQGFGEGDDRIVNGVFGLLGGIRAQWTPTQAETVALMRRAATQKEVARRRGVATSTIHKALKGALYGPLIEGETSLRLLLERAGRS